MMDEISGKEKVVMVTGGSGLLGNELIHQLLSKGERVLAIQHHTPVQIAHPNLLIEACDLGDISRLVEITGQVTEAYHCAGKVSFLPADKHMLYKVNVEGTSNVVEACRVSKVRKLLHVSSVATLSAVDRENQITEALQLSESEKRSAYGESKYLGEVEVWKGSEEGLDMVIVNPSIILGEGNWDDSSTAIFKNVYEGFPWYSTGVNGFVDVKDVAALMILLMKSEIRNDRFLISGHNLMYKDLFEMIAHAFQQKAPNKKITPFLAYLAWRSAAVKYFFTKRKPLVTKETVDTAFRIRHYNNSKILNAFPNYSFIPVEETVKRVAGYLQQKLNMP